MCRGSPVLRERRDAAGSADPLRASSVREQRVSMSAEGLASEGHVLVGGVDVATSGEWRKSLTSRSERGSG